jgi:hypothetical protein
VGYDIIKNGESVPDDPKRIIRILNVSMSIHLIYFIKTRRVIAVGGYIEDKDKWIAAVIHGETHKLIVSTKPVFKTKDNAIEFANELIATARRTKL